MAMAGVLAIRLRPIFIMEEMKCRRSTGKAHWGIGMPQSLPQTFPATRRRFTVAHFLSVAKAVPIQGMVTQDEFNRDYFTALASYITLGEQGRVVLHTKTETEITPPIRHS